MKRKLYAAVSLFSLGALIGTAGASDFENLSVLVTFIAAVVWTGLFTGFGALAMKTPAKKKAARRLAVPIKQQNKSEIYYTSERNTTCR